MLRIIVLAVSLSLLATLSPTASASSDRVGSYIVVLEDSVEDPRAVAREHSRSQNARLGFVYQHALKGYSATMSDVAAARIANDKRVSYVEIDGVVQKADVQSSPTWGLDRIDERALPLDGSYTYNAAGTGVTAYIIDTGVSPHNDFSGRLSDGYNAFTGGSDSSDCDGHGTHVAGTVGGSQYGVAKGVRLVGVRVLDCNGSGTWSGVIAGINWVTGNHVDGTPAVANMSLGGGASASVDQAVANSIADGVTYAVAAGNGNQGGKAQDACGYSPARTPAALTVGATGSTDTKASWSNYGTCVDLFAPGVGITSTVMGGGTESWSGTSMATPHVAGAAALYLQAHPQASPATVASAITSSATSGVVIDGGPGSPNLLLYSLMTAPEPPSVEPVAGATSATVSYTPTGGRTAGKHLLVTVVLKDANNNPVGATSIAVSIALNGSPRWTASGTTSSSGAVTWEIKNAPSGTYSTTVTSVAGTTWGGTTTDPTFAK